MDNVGNYYEPQQSDLMDRKLLEMITQAAAGEAAAATYYTRLSEMLEGRDRKTVYDMALDEAKHRRMFEELYANLAGVRMPYTESAEETVPHGTLPEIFEERVHEELTDVEFYRQIKFALVNMDYRDIMFEIITDEMRHATLLTLLFAKYRVI